MVLIAAMFLPGCAVPSQPQSPPVARKASPFQDYDGNIGKSIRSHWYDLVVSLPPGKAARHGKVVLQFHLNPDGTVTNVKVFEASAEPWQVALCKDAIQQSAPFPPMPPEMVEKFGDYRSITYTFSF